MRSHLALVGFVLCCAAAPAADWKPAAGPLFTRFAKDVSPEKAHPEYPRPQMVRDEWQNLNGLWDYAIRPRDDAQPAQFDGKILVPFPVESALSGVMKRVGPDKRLWYRREVTVPDAWRGKRILLHFEAVDWEAVVSIDGQTIRTHRGGLCSLHDRGDELARARQAARARRLGLGSLRRGHAAVREAAQQAGRDLLHAQHGDLADGVAGAGAAKLFEGRAVRSRRSGAQGDPDGHSRMAEPRRGLRRSEPSEGRERSPASQPSART